jgi:hypothetical protein
MVVTPQQSIKERPSVAIGKLVEDFGGEVIAGLLMPEVPNDPS